MIMNSAVINIGISVMLKANCHEYDLEKMANGTPAKILPMLAEKAATACDVPENDLDVNSIAMTPRIEIEPYVKKPFMNPSEISNHVGIALSRVKLNNLKNKNKAII